MRIGLQVEPGLLLALALSVAVTLPAASPPRAETPSPAKDVALSGPLRYLVLAGNARKNRRLLGPVTNTVHGVPAEPIDSFVYDGEGSVPVDGQLILEVDPIANTGFVQASWTDEHGAWVYTQTRFVHPEHPSGVRIGASVAAIDSMINEGLTHNVHLHGDTQAGAPVLPTVFAFLAAWGPAEVTLDGRPFDNPFELPAPSWLGHVMVTEGVRDEDGAVRNRAGEIYSPTDDAADGASDPGDLEAHVVFHDERFPRTANRPDLFSFFYHLVFEDVVIQIVEAREPIPVPPLIDAPPTSRGRESRR